MVLVLSNLGIIIDYSKFGINRQTQIYIVCDFFIFKDLLFFLNIIVFFYIKYIYFSIVHRCVSFFDDRQSKGGKP